MSVKSNKIHLYLAAFLLLAIQTGCNNKTDENKSEQSNTTATQSLAQQSSSSGETFSYEINSLDEHYNRCSTGRQTGETISQYCWLLNSEFRNNGCGLRTRQQLIQSRCAGVPLHMPGIPAEAAINVGAPNVLTTTLEGPVDESYPLHTMQDLNRGTTIDLSNDLSRRIVLRQGFNSQNRQFSENTCASSNTNIQNETVTELLFGVRFSPIAGHEGLFELRLYAEVIRKAEYLLNLQNITRSDSTEDCGDRYVSRIFRGARLSKAIVVADGFAWENRTIRPDSDFPRALRHLRVKHSGVRGNYAHTTNYGDRDLNRLIQLVAAHEQHHNIAPFIRNSEWDVMGITNTANIFRSNNTSTRQIIDNFVQEARALSNVDELPILYFETQSYNTRQ